jgi:Fur family transcriptional regulator, zinc uptake regulator
MKQRVAVAQRSTGLPEPAGLAAMEARCAERGLRLTPVRRMVLALLMVRGGHASAYELLADLVQHGRHAAPPTVYRALRFLTEAGLVRQIATTRTFELCELAQVSHAVMLVCTCCGATMPLRDESLRSVLASCARLARYEVDGAHTEVHGRCPDCAGRAADALPGAGGTRD